MKSEIKETSPCIQEVTLTIGADEALKDYQKELEQLRKLAVIQGFRKGKAPLSMVEKIHGSVIKEEFIKTKLEDYYKKYLEETDLKIVAPGVPTKVEWDKGQDFIAVFKFETEPVVELGNYKNLDVRYEERELKDEDISAHLENLQKQTGNYEPSDGPIENDYLVKIQLTLLDDAGSEINSSEREIIVGQNQYGPDFNRDIIGLRTNEIFDALLFNKKKAKIKILSIKKLVLPVLDDEFAKDFEFDTLADMQKTVREDMQKQISAENKHRKMEAIYRAIIETNPFEIPAAQLENYTYQLAEQAAKQYKTEIKNLLPLYRQIAIFQIKQYYVLNKLIELENPELTEEDKLVVLEEAASNLNMSVDEYKERYAAQVTGEEFEIKAKEYKILNMLGEGMNYLPYENNAEETLPEHTDATCEHDGEDCNCDGECDGDCDCEDCQHEHA